MRAGESGIGSVRICQGVLLSAFLLLLSFGCASEKAVVSRSTPYSSPQVRQDIVEYALGLLGKPYRSGAKGPEAFDCSGLVHYVYKRFDLVLPVTTERLFRVGREIPRADAVAGDLVVFKIKGDYHVGILINKLEFIHASKSRGVAIDSIDLDYWVKNSSHFRRIL
jgi:cell wall-associated NlpC family hydrolase